MLKKVVVLALGFFIIISAMNLIYKDERNIHEDEEWRNIKQINVMNLNFTTKSKGSDIKYYTKNCLIKKMDEMKEAQNLEDLNWILVDQVEEAYEEYRYFHTFIQEHDELDMIAVKEFYRDYIYHKENDDESKFIRIPLFLDLKKVKYRNHGWQGPVE